LAKRAVPNDRLRRAREERNWTQAAVAEEIGTSGFTVSRWELGVQTPQPYFREKLCALFELSPQELGLIPELDIAETTIRPEDGPRAADPTTPEGTGPDDRREAVAPPAEPEHTAGDPWEARARRDLLAQVWRYWIGTELEAAIGGQPRLELVLTERPGAVDDPMRVLLQPEEPDRPLGPGTTIEAAYRRAGEQLLVLGDPGAGKTTLLLALARSLLETAREQPAARIAVVFHLSSWAEERQPLARWLTDQLHRRYGVAPRLGREWIAGEQVNPLLDGLDEVAEEHRAACVAAINDFHREHGQLPMVVCCRTAQYRSLGARLRLRGAIVIQPLTRTQVERYVADAGESMAAVGALLQDDERLWELLTTPLFLGIVTRTYGGERSAPPALRGTLPERRRHVLADYVDRMLLRPRAAVGTPVGSPHQAVSWLSWLARAMRDHGESVFYLDWMQPTWLPTRAQRLAVTLGPAALVVLVGGLVGLLDMLVATRLLGGHTYLLNVIGGLGGVLHVSLPGQVAGAVLAGAVVGILAGLLAAAFTYERRIAPTDRMRWSWTTFRRNLPTVAAAVLGATLLSLLVDRVLTGLAVHLIYGLMLVLLFQAISSRGKRDASGRPGPWSWTALRRRLPRPWQQAAVLAIGLAVVLAAGTVSAAVSGAPLATVAYRIIARLVVGMSLGLMFGPQTPLYETLPAPGQGIEMSRRNGVAAGLISGALAFLLFGLVDAASVARTSGVMIGVITGLTDGLSIAMIVGVGVSLRRGTGAHLRHALMRGLLVWSGAAPRDYVGFLDHATNLILLRRRGAGYEFVHRLLQEHFADMPTDDATDLGVGTGHEARVTPPVRT
jgi:transcriptional regulator with XRE-family HTH domain/DNA polymerase III delta prime subunit